MGDLPADLPDESAASWADALPPTRGAALARIAHVRPAAYARTRIHRDGAVTGLSPYVTHGLITLREVLAGVLEREPLPVQHKLVFELGWREFFRHAWGHAGDRILQSLHPGPYRGFLRLRPALQSLARRWETTSRTPGITGAPSLTRPNRE